MKSDRIARLATRRQVSMLRLRGTKLMGAARPQTPRRSPRQAFGGNMRCYRTFAATKLKTKTLRNFSFDVSNQRGHATLLHPVLVLANLGGCVAEAVKRPHPPANTSNKAEGSSLNK